MKKFIFGLFVVCAALAGAEDAGKVTVIGDRVSLRAAPNITAVLLDRAMSGDELVLKNNENPDWVGVVPPESVDLWLSSAYVENGKVVPNKLNVRSGPSFNHGVVGVLLKGTEVTVRREITDWVQIAPTAATTVWISRKYVDVDLPEPELIYISGHEAAVMVEESGPAVAVVAEPSVEEVLKAATSNAPEIPAQLVKDTSKEQGRVGSFSGLLLPTNTDLYRLVDLKVKSITVCYVMGNADQMQAFAQLPLELAGNIHWARGLTLPIIVPTKIKIIDG